MEIRSIETNNFKSCPDRKVDLKKINWEIGANGKGKSSFQQALFYGLTGKLPYDPIRHGEEDMSVSVVLGNGQDTMITRTASIPDSYQIDGEDIPKADFIKKISTLHKQGRKTLITELNGVAYQYTGYDPEDEDVFLFLEAGKMKRRGVKQLTAMIDGHRYMYRKSTPSKTYVDSHTATITAVKKFLGDEIGGKADSLELVSSGRLMEAMTSKDFGKYIVNVLPIQITFDKLAVLAKLSDDEARLLSQYLPQSGKITIETIQTAYRQMYQDRTAMGRTMDTLQKQSEFHLLPLPDMAGLKTRYEDIMKQLGQIEARKKEIADYQAAADKKTRMLAEAMNVDAQIAQIKAVDVNAAKTEYAGLTQAEQRLRTMIDEANRIVASLNSANEPIIRMLKNLDTTICPLCSTLICKTDKTACKADLQESIRKNSEAANTAFERAKQSAEELKKVLAREEDIRAILLQQETRAGLIRQKEALLSGVPELPAKVPVMIQSSGLQEEAKRIEEHIRQNNLAGQAAKAYMDYTVKKAEYDLLNQVCGKTEPKKGLLSRTLLQYVLGPLEKRANDFLGSVYGDYSIKFQISDDGLAVFAKPHGRSTYVKAEGLSTGEQMLAAFGIMDTISAYGNTKLMIFDNLENIDSHTLEKLIDVVTAPDVAARYDHILLSSVDHTSIEKLIAAYPEINVIRF